MLKIVGVVEFDGHIERVDGDDLALQIFNVRVGSGSGSSAVWRVESPAAGFTGSSLFYVWVRRSDGSIKDLELVSMQRECVEFVDNDFEFLGEGAPSLPIVDMKLWDAPEVEMWGWGTWPTISESLPLRLFVGDSAFSLRVGNAALNHEVIAFDRFRLGLDDARALRRVDVLDVSREKIDAIRDWLSQPQPPSRFPPTKVRSLRRLP